MLQNEDMIFAECANLNGFQNEDEINMGFASLEGFTLF